MDNTYDVNSRPFCDVESNNTLSIDKFTIHVPSKLFDKFYNNKYWKIYQDNMVVSTNTLTNGGSGGNSNPNPDNFDGTIKPPEV